MRVEFGVRGSRRRAGAARRSGRHPEDPYRAGRGGSLPGGRLAGGPDRPDWTVSGPSPQPPGLVADGRDMGTVIFPGAQLKVFLTASAEERAQRRHKQLIGKGSAASLAALSREIAERDLRDSTRQVAPLKPAPDAQLLDSTGLSIDAVVERVLSLGRERNLWPLGLEKVTSCLAWMRGSYINLEGTGFPASVNRHGRPQFRPCEWKLND